MIPSLHIVARRIFPNIGRCSSPIRPLFLATAAGWTGVFFGLTASEPPARWQPARDDVYLEEVGRKVATAEPLVAVEQMDAGFGFGVRHELSAAIVTRLRISTWAR